MPSVLGIGGVFFRAKDPAALAQWYATHLGLPVSPHWAGAVLPLQHPSDSPNAHVVWSPFKADTTYFGRPENTFMVNFRVDDLDGLIAALRSAGCTVDEKVERSEYGAFGWVTDPEGNRIELWQPPA